MAVPSIGLIARKNARIAFQRRTVTVDRYQNHGSSWEDYFTCFAYASTYAADESGNEVKTEERRITFETRYCPELAEVTSTNYRVVFEGEQYNIESVDPMNYQKKALRFTCRREGRQE